MCLNFLITRICMLFAGDSDSDRRERQRAGLLAGAVPHPRPGPHRPRSVPPPPVSPEVGLAFPLSVLALVMQLFYFLFLFCNFFPATCTVLLFILLINDFIFIFLTLITVFINNGYSCLRGCCLTLFINHLNVSIITSVLVISSYQLHVLQEEGQVPYLSICFNESFV